MEGREISRRIWCPSWGRLSTGDQHFTHKNPGCRVGVKNGNSKLTEELVMEIRKFHQDHPELSQRKIAKHFGMARSHLYSILYSTWKHLPDEPLVKRGAGHNKARRPAPNQATGRTHPPQ